jgi:lipopolysaccharide transport system ATP-binding protein
MSHLDAGGNQPHHIAIQATGLRKTYRIAHRAGPEPGRYRTLREDLMNLIRRPFRMRSIPRQKTIWALRNVSFQVQRGEIVGVIGRNGAGKSTLLKLLSRITRPTTGSADIYGRVGSLLEVGTGFHAELTGRENVFLSGAVLGMSRAEIRQRFDEIIAFAEIESFIDTPVKRYSSGMYMRLAFAVAAHLDTEILLVDEVLAVGDSVFQQKCLGKTNNAAQEGRTVLFVSHNMGAIADLCTRCIFDSPKAVS